MTTLRELRYAGFPEILPLLELFIRYSCRALSPSSWICYVSSDQHIFKPCAPPPDASDHRPRVGLDMMGPTLTGSVIRSNEVESIPRIPHRTKSHQPYPAQTSSSSNEQYVMGHSEQSLNHMMGESNNCLTPAESQSQKLKTLASRDTSRDCDGFDEIKLLPGMNTTSQGTRSKVTETKGDHGKKAATSASIDPATPVPSGPSEPTETSQVVTDLYPVDDNPVYSVGEIKIYNSVQKAIPKLYEARWQAIERFIRDRVHGRQNHGPRALISKFNKTSLQSIEFMSAGVTKAYAMPAVVVVVRRHVEKMQEFLDEDCIVQSHCKPKDGTTVELLAFACKGRLELAGIQNEMLQKDEEFRSDSDSDYLSDSDDALGSADENDSDTGVHSTSKFVEVDPQSVSVVCEPSDIDGDVRHGMRIRLINKDSPRYVRGTCGGLLKLVIPGQPPQQVGLIAGHLLERLSQCSKKPRHNTTEGACVIGGILHPKTLGETPRYDWALFDAANLESVEITNQSSCTVAQESEFPDLNTTVMIRTSRGEMTGTLSSTTSGIMLNTDQGFVPVRTIMMTKGQSLPITLSTTRWLHRLSSVIYSITHLRQVQPL